MSSGSNAGFPQYSNSHFNNQSITISESFAHRAANLEDFREEEIPYCTALSESFDMGWRGFNDSDSDNTFDVPQYPSPIASSFGSSMIWSFGATVQPHQNSPSSPHTDTTQSYWNCDAEHTQSKSMSPAIQILFSPLDTNTEATRPLDPTHHQPDYNHTIHYKNNITSPLFPQNASPPRSPGPANRQTKGKSVHCPNCELLFSRASDLQRHIDGIHLRIRHHCRVLGCGDNYGKGYCRLEKLKGHMLHVHGHC